MHLKNRMKNGRAAALLPLLLAACAGMPAQPPEEIVEQRAQARWDAMLAGDYEAAHAFATPGHRSATSASDLEIEMRTRQVQYVSAEAVGASCEASVCEARVKLEYKVVKPVRGLPEWQSSGVDEEKWILTDGQWWYLPE